jgi:flagellar motor switch protein FliG
MGKDEPVNGPQVAAKILSRMSSEQQQKLLAAISNKDKTLAKKIHQNISTFEDIAELTAQGVQILVKAVEHDDLVRSLKTASSQVKKILFSNMSERKRTVVEQDFELLTNLKNSEIEAAQIRIVGKMDELKTAGLIRSIGE